MSQLKTSGYTRKQAKEVVICGVVGWRRKLERRERAGKQQYLRAEETLEQRTKDKLLEKTNWYKGNKKRKMENLTSKFQYKPPSKKRKRGQQSKGQQQTEKGGEKAGKAVKAVMFIPYTAHSELAVRMRENEEKMEKMTGYRLKIDEKGGTKLIDLLHKANPWAGQDCSRDRCLLCTSKKREDKRNTQDCKKRN